MSTYRSEMPQAGRVRPRALVGMCVLSLTVLAAPTPTAAQVVDFPPVDEGVSDAGFAAFRDSLLAALEANDTVWVRTHTVDDVLNGFGGSGGIDELFGVFWSEDFRARLVGVIRDGGRFDPADWLEAGVEARFMAPYTNRLPDPPADFSGDDYDYDFDTGAVVVDGTPVVDEPGGQVIATLGHVVVIVADWWPLSGEASGEAGPEWVEVVLRDGRRGFAPAAHVRSPLGLRVFFERRGGVWWLAGWAEGD